MNRLVDALAVHLGCDMVNGLLPSLRLELMEEIEASYDAYLARGSAGDAAAPSDVMETLLADLYALDAVIEEAMHAGPEPGDTLQ
jgi:hypothetical protein